MAGPIYLVGGGELARGETEAVDRPLVAEAGARPVATFIGAGSGSRAQAVAFAAYFRRLGARPLDAALYRRQDAADPDVLDRIQRADLIYLGGGSAQRLLDALEGTPALDALRQAHATGVHLAAIDEAAFAVGTVVRPDDEWPSGRPGLGLVPGWVVMPRFDEPQRRRQLRELLAGHPQLRGLGVRPKSAAILRNGRIEAVAGTVEVYGPGDGLRMVRSGEAVPLEE